MRGMTGKLLAVVLALVVLTVGGCGNEAGSGPDSDAACSRDTVEGCDMLGLRFDPAMPLKDALAVAAEVGGTAIAVYRTDKVCVPGVSFGPPGEPVERIASRFAYVDAGAIARRLQDASDGGLSPPITGLHISQSYWTQWAAQWSAAQRGGVDIEGVAVWIDEAGAAAAATDPRVAGTVALLWRRTDSIDPSYPGELLMDSQTYFPGISNPSPPDC